MNADAERIAETLEIVAELLERAISLQEQRLHRTREDWLRFWYDVRTHVAMAREDALALTLITDLQPEPAQ